MEVLLHVTHTGSISELPFEFVERKGRGHPDSICDAVMEAAAATLSREYVQRCGRVLHHNLDKALLVAGHSEPRLGGGSIVSPMTIIAGDRATSEFNGVTIPVDEIVEAAVLGWFGDHLRLVDADRHVAFRSEIKPGSAELAGIFDRDTPVANDTSASVGYAPLTETERLVLETERYINSNSFKERFPVAGEDVKVMAARCAKQLRLTIAVAFVDQFLAAESDYFEQKRALQEDVRNHIHSKLQTLDDAVVEINTLDDPTRGPAGMYLTVVGTSAENGDGGEVGRGNAVNGIISLNRPTSNEAAAGKNAICHVGNIYNYLSFQIANDIVESIGPVQEATVWLCSQIGRPIDEPWSTAVTAVLEPMVMAKDINADVEAVVHRNLQQAGTSHN